MQAKVIQSAYQSHLSLHVTWQPQGYIGEYNNKNHCYSQDKDEGKRPEHDIGNAYLRRRDAFNYEKIKADGWSDISHFHVHGN